MTWAAGDVVTLRHLWGERTRCMIPVRVVADEPGLLVTYLPAGAPMTFPEGETGHRWQEHGAWRGHGMLMLQRPGDPYGVWVFWDPPGRAFDCWYLNIHEWSRRPDGVAIRDLELDVVVRAGSWRLKDEDQLAARVAEGRMTEADVATARAVAAGLVALVERGETWWDPAWAEWAPPPGWDDPAAIAAGPP